MHPVDRYELTAWRNFDEPRRKKKKLSKRQRILAGTIMNNLTKEQLELTITVLQQQLDALTKPEEPSKPTITQWEPKGGNFYILVTGRVSSGDSIDESREFGVERSTEELAEQAAKEMRVFNRLLAYRDEVLTNAAFDYTKEFIQGARNTYVVFDHSTAKYTAIEQQFVEIVGIPSFPPDVARKLANKLNSGEVVL